MDTPLSLTNVVSALQNGTASSKNIADQINALLGGLNSYPDGAVALAASSGNKANASAVATLAGAAAVTSYLTGIDVYSAGATAAGVVTLTITGTGSTLSYAYGVAASVTTMNAPLSLRFSPPLQASAQNVSFVVTLPALGAGSTNATVTAYGYQV